MANKYGITKETETKNLPFGVLSGEVLAVPEVQELTDGTTQAFYQFLQTACGTTDEIKMNDISVKFILTAVQDLLNKSNTGLHIIYPNCSIRGMYNKRL